MSPDAEVADERPAEDEDEPTGDLELHGYGEATSRWTETGGGEPFVGDATLRRVAIELEDRWPSARLGSEIEVEWENAIACDGCRGSVEAEEAFVTWEATDRLRFDAGLILVPFGQLNLDHEPDDYLSVDRPQVDQLVVPTTWRELGVGLRTLGRLRLRAALVTTPDPTRMGPVGLGPAEGLGSHVRANGLAAAARFEAEPVDDLVLSVGAYATDVGRDGDFYDEAGERLSLFLPLGGLSADVRGELGPVGFRGEAVGFTFPDAGVLLAARREDGSPWFVPELGAVVPTRWWGALAEASVDVLSPLDTPQELRPFARVEAYDTTAAVPEGFERDPARRVVDTVLGAAWQPAEPLLVKADLDLRDRELGLDDRIVELGLGWVF